MGRNLIFFDSDKNYDQYDGRRKKYTRSVFTTRAVEVILNEYDNFTKLIMGVNTSYQISKMLPDTQRVEADKYSTFNTKSRSIPNKYMVDNDIRLFNKQIIYIEGFDYRDETVKYIDYFLKCGGCFSNYDKQTSLFILSNEDFTDGVFGAY